MSQCQRTAVMWETCFTKYHKCWKEKKAHLFFCHGHFLGCIFFLAWLQAYFFCKGKNETWLDLTCVSCQNLKESNSNVTFFSKWKVPLKNIYPQNNTCRQRNVIYTCLMPIMYTQNFLVYIIIRRNMFRTSLLTCTYSLTLAMSSPSSWSCQKES